MSENTPKLDIEAAYAEAMRGKDDPKRGFITIPDIGFVQLGPHEMLVDDKPATKEQREAVDKWLTQYACAVGTGWMRPQFDPRPYAAEHPMDLEVEDITPRSTDDDPENVVDILRDRMRRALAGEDIGPTSGLTYGQAVPPKTEEEATREIAVLNFNRGVAQERERCARLVEALREQFDPANDWGFAMVEEIAARIRSGE